jgi:hypothetical protein
MNFSALWKPALAVAGLCFIALPAMAEEQWEFIQPTCSPEMDFFTLRTMHFYKNFPLSTDRSAFFEKFDKLKKRENIYTPQELLSGKAYECHLPNGSVSLEIADYITSQGDELPHYNIYIKVNGKKVDQINSYMIGQPHTDIVEVGPGVNGLQHCTLPAADSAAMGPPVCEGVAFPKDVHEENKK